MRNIGIIFAAIAVSMVMSVSSEADEKGFAPREKEKRLALVIGNADYKTAPLKNTINDANDMEKALRKLGFDVIARLNAGQKDMEEIIREFGAKLRKNDVGLFYYSGHGVQANGENYLIPTDAEIRKESDLKYAAVHAGKVLDEMTDAGNRLNIVILDACRDNSLPKSFRSARQGLAQMDAPSGMLIAYSTSPNSTASDGSRRNGTYTENLLKYMTVPGLPIEKLFKEVRKGVLQDSGNKQRPWESVSITDDFYFMADSGSVATEKPKPVKPTESAPLQKPESVESKPSIGDGKTFTNSIGMKFVYIPPGTFMMGSPPDEPGRSDDETQRKVIISKPFFMQTTEVTVGQWQIFVNKSSYKSDAEAGDGCYVWTGEWKKNKYANWKNPGFEQIDTSPVVCISWNDTQEFLKWLNQKGEGTYRLPTEAEWEYAARAGSQVAFANGDITEKECNDLNLNKIGWYCGNAGNKTHEVGKKQPNAWGLYDIHGNVYEWVQDYYPSRDVTDSTAPNRVIRSGGWDSSARGCRAASRYGNSPGFRYYNYGFRLVVSGQ